MKATSLIMGILALGAAVILMPANAQAQRYDEYCREYTRTVYIGSRQEVAYGTACYQPNGDWKIVDESDRNRIGQRFRDSDVSNGYVQAYQPASRVYYYNQVPQRSRIVFVNDRHGPPYKYGHYKHKRHHDRHDHRRDRYDRYDHRR